MSRRAGSRNQDFEATRRQLAGRIARRMQAADGPGASLRELAAAAEVSPPTLRHYFGDRAGALAAAFAERHEEGRRYLDRVRQPPEAPLSEDLPALLRFVAEGLRAGVARQLIAGLADGRREPAVGRACVTDCLEPILQAVEARLAHHAARGALRTTDLRAAALALLAPLVLAVLHQDELHGAAVRPLDLGRLITTTCEGFVHGYGTAR